MKGLPKEIEQQLEFKEKKGEEAAPPILAKVHHRPKPCEDCERIVCDRHQMFRYHNSVKHYPHWRVTCRSCNLVCNPHSGRYDLTPQQAQVIFNELYLKKTK